MGLDGGQQILCTATIPIVRIGFWKSSYFLCIAPKIFSCRIANTVRSPATEKKSAAGAHGGRVMVLFNIGRYSGRPPSERNLSPYSEAELALTKSENSSLTD
jgi:hypothetical protein